MTKYYRVLTTKTPLCFRATDSYIWEPTSRSRLYEGLWYTANKADRLYPSIFDKKHQERRETYILTISPLWDLSLIHI